jgi:hypothetical protein
VLSDATKTVHAPDVELHIPALRLARLFNFGEASSKKINSNLSLIFFIII